MVSGRLEQPGASVRGSILDLESVSYSYPTGLQALDKVSFSIGDGEIVAIVGPSGCGKSTLLSAIAGLVRVEGSIDWNPDAIDDIDDVTRKYLTIVFQRDTVLPWLTVEKNVGFGLRFLKISNEERSDRIERMLKIGGLEEFRRAYPRQLSGGMRRRVALLSGIAPMPKLLLLDEPFSALDEPTRVVIHSELLRIVYELGMSVMLVTHDLSEAITVADRVIILSQRPATVAAVHEIGLGHDRDLLTIRETTTYQDLYAGLWGELWKQIRK